MSKFKVSDKELSLVACSIVGTVQYIAEEVSGEVAFENTEVQVMIGSVASKLFRLYLPAERQCQAERL